MNDKFKMTVQPKSDEIIEMDDSRFASLPFIRAGESYIKR